jgi:hypothetical protein
MTLSRALTAALTTLLLLAVAAEAKTAPTAPLKISVLSNRADLVSAAWRGAAFADVEKSARRPARARLDRWCE